MSGGGVDIAARQAWFEEQAALAESEWIDFFQERFEGGDDVPDKEHFIALWLAERDPLATDLAAAIERAEAAERDAARFAFCVARDVFPVRDNGGVQWVMFVAVTSARRSLFIGDTPAEAIDAAIAAQQAEGEDRG